MELEILNKKNDKVLSLKANNIATITFTKNGRITFTHTAAEQCGLRIGMYVHFAILNKKTWLMFVNNDSNGYKLFAVNNNKSSQIIIESITIVRLFHNTFSHELPARYYIQDTHSEQNGNKLFEILTHKPINKIGD